MRKFLLILFLSVLSDVYAYEPGTRLLERNGMYVSWGQKGNDDNSCSPSYNYCCPVNDKEKEVNCGHMLASCGAIAMAQIMYKWAYPTTSKHGTYDWNKIPAVLTNGCSLDCPKLIYDCGKACNMHYQSFAGIYITGSWSTISNIAKGFEDFNYSARVVDLDEWRYGNAWADLIRSEIDCGRPVLMYGQHNKIEIKEKHYFVIDGYSKENIDLFHVNWGWKGSNNGYYNLEKCGKSNGQKIILGISPHNRTNRSSITFQQKTKMLTPNCRDGINDYLTYQVNNADSYECIIYDRSGKQIWACAGLIKDGYAYMWDGSSIQKLYYEDYWYEVYFKNSKGESVSTSGHVLYNPNKCNPDYVTDIENIVADNDSPIISPNPSKKTSIITSKSPILSVLVLDLNAKEILNKNINSYSYTIDISKFSKGVFIVVIRTEDRIFFERLVVI